MKFWPFLKIYRWTLALAFICIAFANLLALVLPWAVKLIIDDVLGRGHRALLPYILLGLVAAALLRFFLSYGGTYLGMAAAERTIRDLRARLYHHLLRLSVIYVENASTGVLIQRVMGDIDAVRYFLLSGILDFLYSVLSAAFILAVLFWMDFRMALLSALFFPAFIAVYSKLAGSLSEKYKSLGLARGNLSGRLGEVLRGIRTVHAFHQGDYEIARFARKQGEVLRTALEAARAEARFLAAAELLSLLGLVALLGLGAYRVTAGQMTLGTLVAFYAYVGMLFVPFVRMAAINGSLQDARASWERIRGILDEAAWPKEAANPVALEKIKGEVEFRDTTFSYGGGRPALSGIRLKVNAGEVVALVGPSGAGKTTLVSLLARFFDPLSGQILIDGHDLRNLKIKNFRSRVAVVLQGDFLFSGSLRENILYGNPDAGEKEIVEAAKAANIHDFIMSLPRQYESEVGEGGVKLSGGERQRVAIARAILKDPSLLILDEATSSVDSAAESLIADAVRRLMKGRTTFVIAHRPSTIREADRIVVLEAGRIVDSAVKAVSQ